MKVVELLAELQKINGMMKNLKFYSTQIGFSNSFCPSPMQEDMYDEKILKSNYEKAMKLLRRADALNDALHESDAKTYVDVMGMRMSVATARQYLDEFHSWSEDEVCDFGGDHVMFDGDANLRWSMLDKCCVSGEGKVECDPLNLKERRNEFVEKKIDWYLGLKTAVAISDATTEVAFCD